MWTIVLPELDEPQPEELTSCDNVDAVCDADCELSHNAFWTTNNLNNVNPAVRHLVFNLLIG